MVSFSFPSLFQSKITIGVGFLKEALMSFSDLPSFFIIRQRSEVFIARSIMRFISSVVKSKKGAVLFLSGVF